MNPRKTAGRLPAERVSAHGAVQAALFPVMVTAVRREIIFARPDGGPLTDGDFAAIHRLVRDGAA